VQFIGTLAGFVPDDRSLEQYALPMEKREVRIAYRGRQLPFRYGDLARQKYEIGVKTRALAEARGVRVDIDWSESSRIYGEDWYRFLGSARAMLATESGSNVFDFDGNLHAAEAVDADLDYAAFHTRHLAHLDGKVTMNQMPPKAFEAISLRTALVCFEGHYSGVIRPNEHFISLKHDFSNIDEVFARLEDVEGLKAMTDRAYRDVIASGVWSYPTFIAAFDKIIEDRLEGEPRATFISAPILVQRRGERRPTPVVRPTPLEYVLNDTVMYGAYQRRDLEADMAKVREAESTPLRTPGAAPPAVAAAVFEAGPDAVRCYEYWSNAGAALDIGPAGAAIRTPAVPWHYAAGVHLDLSTVDPRHQHAWVRAIVADVKGDLRVGLYNPDTDALSSEQRVPEGPGPHTLYLSVRDPQAGLLVYRTGDQDRSASGVVQETAIQAASRYNPVFLELARKLAELPPEDRPWPVSAG
jgi:hypothetical protein